MVAPTENSVNVVLLHKPNVFCHVELVETSRGSVD